LTARVWISCLAALALAVLIAGCGDGGDSAGADPDTDTVAASSLTKPAYVKKADAICSKGAGEALAYKPPPEVKSEKERLPALIENSLVPRFRAIADELHSLGAPSEDEAQIEEYLAALEQSLDEIEARGNSISSIGQLEDSLDRVGRLARDYGFTACAF
jgi:hypothetical protein